ncbi:probable methyltransferase PMT24 [Tanacetum coccineum]
MESEKYLEGQSMQRPPLFESDGFIYWKNRFETYVKSKDLDLWHVITDGDFPPIQFNPETKKDEIVSFHKQDDDLKKKLAKNNEAKMVIYNALPHKEYERIFMCQTAKEIWDTLLITHQVAILLKNGNCDSSDPLPNAPLSSLPKPKASPLTIQYLSMKSYTLAVQWPPGVCSGKHPKYNTCKIPIVPTEFTIHGLWPEYSPTDPPATKTLNYNQLGVLTTDLKKSWPNLWSEQKLSGENLVFWNHEWVNHGRFSEMEGLDYFRKTLDLFKDVGEGLKGTLKAKGIEPVNAQFKKDSPGTHLESPPYRLKSGETGVYGKLAPEDFTDDYKHWKNVVTKSYLNGLGIDWSSIRNVMHKRSIYGGSEPMGDECGPLDSPDTLPIIYERGAFGIFHNWCKLFITYPRTYDILHAGHLFLTSKKRCKLETLIAEVDRVLQSKGKLIVRYNIKILAEIENMVISMHWNA